VARHELSADEIAQVLSLVEAAAAADGVHPLSERTMLALRRGLPGLLAQSGDRIVGYAYRGEGSAELVVHPEQRGRGHGRALATALRTAVGGGLRVWAHGELPAAGALAAALGWRRVRVLWQMRRPLTDSFPDVRLPAGIRIRTFEIERDEEAWTALNRLAFADHPEQGAWTVDDLLLREQEPWFDPDGLLLAEDTRDAAAYSSGGENSRRLVGFHWTKVHDRALGEVYVVGVDPAARGRGLGKALTVAGLNHLRSRGLITAMLYVDDENAAAITLYKSLGFTRWSADVMYG
jgi:mycothiol synthase